KIVHTPDWQAARAADAYEGSAKDKADGFLHFSTADQLLGTLTKWYADAHDLVLVAVAADSLGGALKWEPSRDGALFPHLYAPLSMTDVQWTGEISRDSKGAFVLPTAFAAPKG
ncbi:MAG: DUF952 domain-containing protein, partial [Pseudomonadota bacterium]|nr:DUF952 domain-containing protein [Pseudomonadota bacterium]